MLAARMVGPAGAVVGIERDAGSIARARARVAEDGFSNVEFVQTDVAKYSTDELFDAVIGRCVLQFLPDPIATLRSLVKLVRSGGIVLMQEGSWAPYLALSAHLPLWSATVSLMHAAAIRSGVNLEMGPELHRVFQQAGLPAPRMRLVMELDSEPGFTRWLSDSLQSLQPTIQKLGLSTAAIGDLDSLAQRLHDEVASSNTVVPWIALVGAWCRKP
jgi:ubiquinone/menaquinone biosynthesis C-methylase UbiE